MSGERSYTDEYVERLLKANRTLAAQNTRLRRILKAISTALVKASAQRPRNERMPDE